MSDHRVVRVAGHEEDGDVGPRGPKAVRQLAPAHARHDHVGQHEVDLPRVRAADLEGIRAVTRTQDGVPRRLQGFADDLAQVRLVLHEQDGLGSPRHLAVGRRAHFLDGGVHPGQIDPERRALSFRAFQVDVALALGDDAVHGRQTETGSLADLLGREEGLEDAGPHLGGHAMARVRHRQHHVAACLHGWQAPAGLVVERHVGRLDRQPPASRHRVTGIDGEVHEDLVDLPGVALHLPEVLVQDGHQLDVLPDHAPQHLLGLADGRIQIEDARVQDLFAG
jgi:hypothetical protein